MKNNRLKNLLFLMMFGLLFFTYACKEEMTEIMTVASERPDPISPGYEIIPTYWVKFSGKSQWARIVETIRGFDYTEGYEYVIEVKEEYTGGDPLGDAIPYNYVLLRVISKEKKESEDIPK